MDTKSRPSILILAQADSRKNVAINDRFVEQLNVQLKGVCTIEWQNYHNVGFRIETNKLEPFLVSDGRLLTSFTAVHFKSYFRYTEQAVCVAEALQACGVPFVGRELVRYISAYKLSQMARMALSGLPLPSTLYLPPEHYVKHFEDVQKTCGLPFIFKAVDGKSGNDNHLVASKHQLESIIKHSTGKHFIAQSYIDNDGDLRIIIVGNSIKLVIERRRRDNTTHLNNTSKGAVARLIEHDALDTALQQLALRAAQAVGRDVAGVDLMVETSTAKPYILEVNPSPQIGSGAFEAEKLTVFANYYRGLIA